MSVKLEEFEERKETLEGHRRIVGYYEEALKRLNNGDRVFIEGMLAGRELCVTFEAAVERELAERRRLVTRLEDELENRLK